MISETIRYLIGATIFSLALFAVALLSGCAVEGAGFSNNERHARPVVCREVRPGYTKCRSV